MSELLLDAAGRRRSPATTPGFHAGRPPRNKGLRYPADPPTVEEIVAVMRAARTGPHGFRLRGLIAVLWRAGLRIHEALALGRQTWTGAAGRCWCGAARPVGAAKSAWTSGRGSNYSRQRRLPVEWWLDLFR
jgi:integrase